MVAIGLGAQGALLSVSGRSLEARHVISDPQSVHARQGNAPLVTQGSAAHHAQCPVHTSSVCAPSRREMLCTALAANKLGAMENLGSCRAPEAFNR